MKKVVDERVRMPLIFHSIFWATFGICGTMFIVNSGNDVHFSESIRMLSQGITSGLAGWGLVNIIVDIRRGKTVKGFIQRMRKTLLHLYD
jgi:hypothetical protein